MRSTSAARWASADRARRTQKSPADQPRWLVSFAEARHGSQVEGAAGSDRRRRGCRLRQGGRCFSGGLSRWRRSRCRRRRLPRRRQGGRPVGRLPERFDQGPVAGRHHREHVLHDQRCRRPGRGRGGVSRTGLLRRQGRRLLAGIRAGRQGRRHRPSTPGTSGRSLCAQTEADAGRRGRSGAALADPGVPSAGVATGDPARISRDHARLVRVGADPTDRSGRPDARWAGTLRTRSSRPRDSTCTSDCPARSTEPGLPTSTTGRARKRCCIWA